MEVVCIYMIVPEQVLKIQASSLKRLPECLTFLHHLLPSMHFIAFWGVFSDWLAEEEDTRAWFMDGFARYAGTTQKRTAEH